MWATAMNMYVCVCVIVYVCICCVGLLLEQMESLREVVFKAVAFPNLVPSINIWLQIPYYLV